MVKIKCQCGYVNVTYSPPRFCQGCHKIFNEQTNKPAVKAAQPVKSVIKKPVPVSEQTKNVSYKKPLTVKQKKYYEKLSDTMQSVKTAMSGHIIDKIMSGYYTITEFMADPGIYFDSRIMGRFINNSVMRKQVIKAVELKIYGDLL